MEWSAKSIMVLIVLYTLLIMIFILLSRKQKQLSDKFLILYALVEIFGLHKFFVPFAGNEIFLSFPQYYFISIPVCYTYAPVFYLYFLSNVRPDFVFRRIHWFHFALFALFLLYYSIRYFSIPVPEIQHLIHTRPTYIRIEWRVHEMALMAQYLFYSVLLLLASKEIFVRKKEANRKNYLLIVLIAYLAGIVISLIITALALLGVNTAVDVSFWGIMYFYAFFVFLFFMVIRKIESDRLRKFQTQLLPDDAKAREVETYVSDQMEKQKLYLDPELTLSGCAQRLNLDVKEFSFVLNHRLRENFNEYINRLRIAYAKEMLMKHPKMTVQEIMYDSGFNSKAVFYVAFKKHTRVSPNLFRKTWSGVHRA